MSIKALNWAFAQKLENSSNKFVLVALADSADDFGICWPSYNTIAKKTSLHRATVIRAVNALIDQKLITKKSRFKAQGQNSNAFQLQIGVKIEADHPLYDLVAQRDHPSRTERPPQSQSATQITNEPIIEKKALSRDEFLRVIDKGYQESAFEEWPHLTETEIKQQAQACLDFYGAKDEWPAGNPVYVLRTWIRGGIKNGNIRKADKPAKALQESKPEIKSEALPQWKQELLKRVGAAAFASWMQPLELIDGELIAPTTFHAQWVTRHYEDHIEAVLTGVKVIHREHSHV